MTNFRNLSTIAGECGEIWRKKTETQRGARESLALPGRIWYTVCRISYDRSEIIMLNELVRKNRSYRRYDEPAQ